MSSERHNHSSQSGVSPHRLKRVSAESKAALQEHLIHREPVIITGLFNTDPVDKIRTMREAVRKLGKLPVIVQDEYYSDFLKCRNLFRQRSRRTTLEGFLNLLSHNPRSRLVVTEYPTVAELSPLISVPDICRYRYGLDGSEGVASEIFIAGAGNAAHLHFDWDHRHVLLYQVFGRKRVSLIFPEKSALLNPVLNMSQLNLESVSMQVKRQILGTLEAYSDVLNPGETVYMPPLIWHCLEYIDTAMSISFRFGRTDYCRIFQERFHPNMHLQNIAWAMLDHEELRGEALHAYRRIIREYRTAPRGGFALYKRMQGLFEDIYRELCPRSIQQTCWLPVTELINRQVRLGLAAGVLYPKTISRLS